MKLNEMLTTVERADEAREQAYEMLYGRVGEQLMKERKDAGLSRTELAERVGVSMSWIAKIENGQVRVSKNALRKIIGGLK